MPEPYTLIEMELYSMQTGAADASRAADAAARRR